jgi:hypothetical protein
METQTMISPRVTRVSWGEMEIEGVGSGRDFKLWPGGGRDSDWSETGTHHVPGIQVDDVEELIQRGSTVVVLSRGMELRLLTSPATLEYLKERGVQYYVEETNEAVRLYNDLAESGERVGGLFHSTC